MSDGEYSRGRRDGPASATESTPDTIDAAVRAAVRMPADGRGSLSAPRTLQSWPGIVHGGAVVALLDAAARGVGFPDGARVIEGRLTSSLPIDTALAVETEPGEHGTTLIVRRDGQVVSSAMVGPAPTTAAAIESRTPSGAETPASSRPSPWTGGPRGVALPMSDHCLACGAHNPLGLKTRLSFGDEGVWARVVPGRAWRAPRGRVHAALAPVLLDEVSWWLGALVAQQGGLTNRITVALTGVDAEWDEPVVAAGRFAEVTPVDRRGAFWRAQTALATESGTLLATGSVVFRGGAEYSAIQMDYFRARTTPEVFGRMFPSQAAADTALASRHSAARRPGLPVPDGDRPPPRRPSADRAVRP